MKAVVVGTGAGGAAAARELTRQGFQVTALEAGSAFSPMTRRITLTEPLRRSGLLGTEKMIGRLFPAMAAERSSDDLVLVRGMAEGGCTTIACGNLVRATNGLAEIGLDLTPEFELLEAELKPLPVPENRWRPLSQAMFRAAETAGLDPSPTPKAVDLGRCVSCGLCEVGCASGAKWDSRRWLEEAKASGARVQMDSRVASLVLEDDRVVGVCFGRKDQTLKADVVVLAAGAIGTAQILKASGIKAEDRLWADIVLTIGGRSRAANMLREPPMVWFAKQKGFIVSPYLDILSHWFHEPWRDVALKDRVGVMIKLADDANGEVRADGTVAKALSQNDIERLDSAASLVESIMREAGIEGLLVRGMLNGGHLGGTVPLRPEDVASMHPSSLPDNVYVADLSLLPRSQGMPTMLTASALSLRVAKRICERWGR